ncbi:MAG: hypothetical protein K2X71_15665 [Methylobacterium sp.]|uniref:hypothetical protein n=1 Tax=Methylobacterium sp. TaxID=409 RepID=UPI00258FAEF7|nr:hypothetical protein [Methylobacterium sp.]MBY0297452.1 hypothetical protein [Methylobacterium sp.]
MPSDLDSLDDDGGRRGLHSGVGPQCDIAGAAVLILVDLQNRQGVGAFVHQLLDAPL